MTWKPALLPVAAVFCLTASAADVGDMERTLSRLARVAELYRDTALGFACQETIAYSGDATGRIQFAYLFIRDDHGRLRDFRTWKTGTTAKERGREVNPADYRVPAFLESAYLWAFIFRADRQPLFHFEKLRDETSRDRAAIVIQFVPRAPIRKRLNDWAGYAWIDRDTTQILKVEAYSPADWNRKMRSKAELLIERQPYDIERVVTEFGFEKNGMRFPSHVELTTTRHSVVSGNTRDELRESTVQTLTQDYSRFEFYSVRSSDEIMRFVDGAGPLPAVPGTSLKQ
jgi:hypothetical protein